MTDIELGDTAPGSPVAVAIGTDATAICVGDTAPQVLRAARSAEALASIEAAISPRWVWWSKDTARAFVELGIRPARCWDLGAVHRLLFGGWRSGPEHVWAGVHDLDVSDIPTQQPVDLFTHDADTGDPDLPLDRRGYLRAEWVDGSWDDAGHRLAAWVECARAAQRQQAERIAAADQPARAHATALSESAAELLCAELEIDGLPIDVAIAESIIAGFVGPRPTTTAEAQAQLDRRDAEVLRHLPIGTTFDLRSPDQVKSLLRRVGIEVPDTRAWRLETLRGAHPIVEPLLAWRRAERVLTTFGYSWLDEHVDAGSSTPRLRGSWSGSDGAAGRMTATAGLHNMPSELRPAIVADNGHAFVRADLGQIEPRILAAVSGDRRLAAASQEDDMYAPVAAQLRVERDVAKVAVLGAMYGQTTGKGAEALRGLEREYPVAMNYLDAADRAAQGSNDLRTFGGRLVPMGSSDVHGVAEREARSRAAARGRYGRNALVQGAAAEFFKTWAVLMRARSRTLGARIVLCLHDEIVIHTPIDRASETAALLDRCLDEAAHRWAPVDHSGSRPVRFVSDTSVIQAWSEAK